jgi:GAF domain-containing protein
MNGERSSGSTSAQAGVVIAGVLAALADDFDPPALLATIADHARSGLNAYSVVVMLLDRQAQTEEVGVEIVAEAVPSGVPVDLDFQTSGPGLHGAVEGVVTMIDDLNLAADTRWPAYRQSALAAGMSAVRAFPIVSLGVSVGALVVHTDEPWGSDRPNAFGQIMANLIAVALASGVVDRRQLDTGRTIETLLEGRVAIASASGILAEVLDLDVRPARLTLNRLARAHGRSVSAHAREIVNRHNADPSRSSPAASWARPPDLLAPPRQFDE